MPRFCRGTPISDIPLVQFEALSAVPHGVSTRLGGVSDAPFDTLNLGYGVADDVDNVATNRFIFASVLGAPVADVVAGRLTHGKEVSVFDVSRPDTWPVIRVPVRPGLERTMAVFDSDAVVSNVPGMHFLLTFADCVPLLFLDPSRGVIGAAHAGWRGTAQGIALEVVRTMEESFRCRPADLVAAIGPSIGPCCYQVGPEVPRAFENAGLRSVMRGSSHLDLWGSNRAQMRAAGIPDGSIHNHHLCTSCHKRRFFSHRASGGKTGRLALGIGLT